MKKKLLPLCGFFLLACFTGCIEIFEEIILNDKGGGHVQQKLDISQMMQMMEMMKDGSKENKDDKAAAPEDNPSPEKEALKDWESLKNIEGISNVRIVNDTIGHIYYVDFDFANETALNKAMSKKENGNPQIEEVYSISKSSITRKDANSFGKMTEDETEESREMMKTVLADMKYHLSITVPGKIKSVSNNKAEINDKKTTVTLDASYRDIDEKKTSLGIRIVYKK